MKTNHETTKIVLRIVNFFDTRFNILDVLPMPGIEFVFSWYLTGIEIDFLRALFLS